MSETEINFFKPTRHRRQTSASSADIGIVGRHRHRRQTSASSADRHRHRRQTLASSADIGIVGRHRHRRQTSAWSADIGIVGRYRHRRQTSIPRSNKGRMGARGFSYACPTAWNSLNDYLKKNDTFNIRGFQKAIENIPFHYLNLLLAPLRHIFV